VQATPACRAPNGWIRPSRTDGTAVGLVLALFSPAEQAACSQNRLSFIFLSTSVFSSEFAFNTAALQQKRSHQAFVLA
jgi:hypothetical protein